MAIAILASQQLDEVNGSSHSKPPPSSHVPQMVTIPHESDAMEVDVIGLSSSNPSNLPRKFYINECKQQSICTRCLFPYNDTHCSPSGAVTFPNAAATLQAKVDFLKNLKKNILPRSVPPPPAGPPQPVQQTVAAVASPFPPSSQPPSIPYPHTQYPQASWGHPYPPHPPFHYGYQPFSAPPPAPLPVSSHPNSSSQSGLPPPATSVSAVLSEYADLYSPVYYDLPGSDYSQTTPSVPTPLDPDSSPTVNSASVAAMTFSGSSTTDSRLILSVMLLVGKRMIRANALIDSGSGGDFINSAFVDKHQLRLSPRKVPLQCLAFDGSPSSGGHVTHFWEG